MSAQRKSPLTWTCTSEAETQACAAEIAADLQPGNIILLGGDLGAGKTTFARALIRHMAGDAELHVPSPTYTLVQTYDTPRGPIWHFDLYRLKDPDEIFELGWDDALTGGILLIEWPDKLGPYKPKQYTQVDLSPIQDNPTTRTIHLTDIV